MADFCCYYRIRFCFVAHTSEDALHFFKSVSDDSDYISFDRGGHVISGYHRLHLETKTIETEELTQDARDSIGNQSNRGLLLPPAGEYPRDFLHFLSDLRIVHTTHCGVVFCLITNYFNHHSLWQNLTAVSRT